MDPDLLNNLYLIGGLLAAIFVIVWRFTSASQKAIQYSVDSLQLQIKDQSNRITKVEEGVISLQVEMVGVKDRLGKVEEGLVVVDDRVRGLQMEMVGVKDRLTKVEGGVVVVDDRVRGLQMDMAVVKDRLHILTDDRPASPVPVRAGVSVPQATAAEA